MENVHPFWGGFFQEIRKHADAGEALRLLENPYIAGGVAAAGTAAGLGAVALKRKLFPGKAVPSAATAVPAAGFGAKHMLMAGGAGLLGGYLFGRRDKEK